MKRSTFLDMLLFAALTGQVSAADFTDWTDGSFGVAHGVLGGVSVTFAPYDFPPITDGSSTYFNTNWFSPPLPLSDAVFPSIYPTNRVFTFTFGAPVRDPVVHVGSLASVLTFTTTNITRLSGEAAFVVSGGTVTGQYIPCHPCPWQDTHGSIRLDGVFCAISFTGITLPGIGLDGLWLQIGGTPVLQPSLTVRRVASSIELAFQTDNGISYQVQYSPILPATNWMSLGSPILGDGTTNVFSDTTRGLDARFYRVHILVCQ